jgi:hypothetical protein
VTPPGPPSSPTPPNGAGGNSALGEDGFVLRALLFLDGLLDDAAVAAFNAELAADAGRRETFVRVCELRGHLFEYRLATEANGEGSDEEVAGPAIVPPPWFEAPVEVERPRRWGPVLAVAAAVLCPLVLAATFYLSAQRSAKLASIAASSATERSRGAATGGATIGATTTGVATTEPVAPPAGTVDPVAPAKAEPLPAAVLVATAAARWGDRTRGELRPGQSLPGGAIDLEAGFAEVRLKSGATFIVEAPARFEVRADAMAVELGLGKVTATVPAEARGFAVRTASATVVDFGTEVGVEAAADRSTRVEVFRGEVEAKAAHAAGDGAEAGRRLSHDQAVEVGADALAMKSVPPTPPEKVGRAFLRDLSQARLPLPFRNTGADVQEAQEDPNWQYVAGPTGPLPQPRPAIVFPAVANRYGTRARAKWISAEKGPHDFPAGAFTFRTHVDLAGFNLATADIAAHVLVDNFIKDVRVNGKRTGVSLPSDRNNTVAERTIRIPASAFKPGTNEIEFVVINEPMDKNQPSPMALLLEWSATVAPEISR